MNLTATVGIAINSTNRLVCVLETLETGVRCDIGNKFLKVIYFNFRNRRFLKCETSILTCAKLGTFSAIFVPLNIVIYLPMKARRMVMHVGSQTPAVKVTCLLMLICNS